MTSAYPEVEGFAPLTQNPYSAHDRRDRQDSPPENPFFKCPLVKDRIPAAKSQTNDI